MVTVKLVLSIFIFMSLCSCNEADVLKERGLADNQKDWRIYARQTIKQLIHINEEYIKEKNKIYREYPSGQSYELDQKIAFLLGKDIKDITPELRSRYWLAKYRTEKYVNLESDIKMYCYDLWEATGRSCFLDIPCNELPDNVQIVIKRYNEYMSNNLDVSKEVLLRKAIQETVEAIDTEYCNWALEVIKKYVSFKGGFGPPAFQKDCYCLSKECGDIFKKHFEEEYSIWNRWYMHNKNNLIWNSKKHIFESHQGISFELPYLEEYKGMEKLYN